MRQVAVYGTLKRGHANHRAFLRDARFRRSGPIRVPYRLFGSDEYPMLIPAERTSTVVVEVFAVDSATLKRLDRFEARFGYRRTQVVPLGEEEPLSLYFHPGPPPEDFREVPGGAWEGVPAAFRRALARHPEVSR